MAQQKTKRNAVPRQLYTSAVADLLTPEQSPWCQNVRFRYGQVNRCPGRSIPLQVNVFLDVFMDFAAHVNAAGTETVFGLGKESTGFQARPYDQTARQFVVAQQAICPGHYDDSTRFSWTQGEERLFVVNSSNISAINVTAPNVFTVENLLTTTIGATTTQNPLGLFVEYFSNHLFLLNTKDMSNRIQWSARAIYYDWATITGHGGFLDLYDGVVEPITGGKVLNNRLVVYRKSSITDMVPTGDDTNPFLPEGRAYGIGCMSPWSLVSLGQFHIFFANDFNVYIWDGTKLNPVGTPIHNYIRQLYDPERSAAWYSRPFAAAFMAFKEYWLGIYDYLNNQIVVLIYDYMRDAWTRDVFPASFHAMFERNLIGAEGTAGYNRTGYPQRWPALMAANGADYFMIDERVEGDRLMNPSTGSMEMFVETSDFYYGEDALQNGTMQRALVVQGTPRSPSDPGYHFDLSIDRGNSWIETDQIVPVDTHWGYEFLDFNATSNVYRWRFRCIAPVPVWDGAHWDTGFWDIDYWATLDTTIIGAAAKPSWRSYTSVYVPSGEFFPIDRPVGEQSAERGTAKVGEPRAVLPTGLEGG